MGSIVQCGRQAELARELKRRSLRFIDGMGLGSQAAGHEKWPREASFLVLGLSLEASRAPGRKHERNAVFWGGKDAVSQPVVLQ